MIAFRWLCALFFLFYGVLGFSQHALEGVITDGTGKPLWGASIYISDLYTGTTTNEQGYYILNDLPRGDIKVQFSYVGFESQIITVSIIDSLNTINTHLHQSVIEAHEVVISTAYPSAQDENPVKVEQMTMKELKKMGGVSLMQSISSLPGVNQVSTGIGISKPVIRGLSYNRVLVYGLGTRIENQQWGDEHGLGLSDMGVERIEIIKGPSSLLYGSDAMGGVMHLIEEKPANVRTFVGDYNATFNSNTLGYSTNLGLKTSSKHIRFGIRAGTESHADYMQGNGIRVSNSRFKGNAIKSSLGYTNHLLSTTINSSYLNSFVGIPAGTEEQTKERTPEPSYQHLETLITSVQNNIFLGKSKIKLNAGYIINSREEFEDESLHEGETEEEHNEHEGEAGLSMKLKTFNYDLKFYTPKVKMGEVIIGIQGMNQRNKNSGEEILIPDAAINDIGLSAMTKFDINKTLIQVGVRVDNRSINTLSNTNNYRSINGAFGGTYKLNHKVLFRANIATGYRAPNLAELTSDGVHHGTNRYEIGNMQLKSEQNIEFDISSHFHTDHATADISGFYNHINNYIFLNPTGELISGFDSYTYIQKNAILYGGEFTLDLHPHPLDWLHLKGVYSMVIGQQQSGEYLPLIPANKLTTSINLEFKGTKSFHDPYINISWNYVFEKSNVSPIELPTDNYNLLNCALGSEISTGKRHLTLGLSAHNLLNTVYYDHLSRLKPDGLYNMGRNIQINLKIPFGIK